MVFVDTIQLGHDLTCLVDAAVAVSITGGLGKEKSTESKNQRPGKADSHGDSPRGSGLDGLGTEVDDVGDEDTEGDEELECTDHGTADLAGGGLRLVHGDDAGQRTDPQTSNPTAHGNLNPVAVRSNLHNNSDHVDHGPEGHGELATHAIRDGGGDEGSDHSTDAELEQC